MPAKYKQFIIKQVVKTGAKVKEKKHQVDHGLNHASESPDCNQWIYVQSIYYNERQHSYHHNHP